MTDRDAFLNAGSRGKKTVSSSIDAKFQRFIDRTVKRHPELKDLKSGDLKDT